MDTLKAAYSMTFRHYASLVIAGLAAWGCSGTCPKPKSPEPGTVACNAIVLCPCNDGSEGEAGCNGLSCDDACCDHGGLGTEGCYPANCAGCCTGVGVKGVCHTSSNATCGIQAAGCTVCTAPEVCVMGICGSP